MRRVTNAGESLTHPSKLKAEICEHPPLYDGNREFLCINSDAIRVVQHAEALSDRFCKLLRAKRLVESSRVGSEASRSGFPPNVAESEAEGRASLLSRRS